MCPIGDLGVAAYYTVLKADAGVICSICGRKVSEGYYYVNTGGIWQAAHYECLDNPLVALLKETETHYKDLDKKEEV